MDFASGVMCRRFAVVLGISGRVSESVIIDLIVDPRLLRHIDEYENDMILEAQWASVLDPLVYYRLSVVAGAGSPMRIYHDVMHSVWHNVAYSQHNLFTEARAHPFSIAVGNQDVNLDTLEQSAVPVDVAAMRIRNLALDGFPRKGLKTGLDRMLDVSFTSLISEQDINGISVNKRFHPEYCREMLQHRAYIHNLVPLVRQPVEDSLVHLGVTKLIKRIDNNIIIINR